MYIMTFLFLAGGIFVIWAMIMSLRNYNFLKENGLSGVGEIVGIIECTDVHGMKLYDIKYIYNDDDDGNQQTGRATFEKKRRTLINTLCYMPVSVTESIFLK